MGHEFSAGVILFCRRAQREYLILDYGSHWDFPKGHVEPGETAEATARRELQEETGIGDACFVPGFRQPMRYFYRRGSERMRKVVTYFLAETRVVDVRLSHEHCGFAWLPFEQAQSRLTFKTARDLLSAAETFLAQAG